MRTKATTAALYGFTCSIVVSLFLYGVNMNLETNKVQQLITLAWHLYITFLFLYILCVADDKR